MDRKISVIIPTYCPGEEFAALLERLEKQTLPPERILIINTEEEKFDPHLVRDWTKTSVFHIAKEEFDHGGTRDMAARMCDTPLLLFMTMDAVPAGRHLLERLADAFEDPRIAAAYARQLPKKGCGPEERYAREFNYGPESMTKGTEDLEQLGIRTWFCSDVCAMYRRDRFLELGGFVSPVIFNEDMLFAAKAVDAGYTIRYCADAQVIHSHDYTPLQQLRRNFDLGVSHADYPEVFGRVKAEGTGVKMVLQSAGRLIRDGYALRLPRLFGISAAKFIGYRLGKNYRSLPGSWIPALTSNRQYWITRKRSDHAKDKQRNET